MPLISEIHIATLKASIEKLRGCDPLKPLSPRQVCDVVASCRKVLDEFEKEALKESVQVTEEVAHAKAGG